MTIDTGKLDVALTADRSLSMWAHTYTDLTTRTRTNTQTIIAGRRERTAGLTAAQLDTPLDNGDGFLTPGNPEALIAAGAAADFYPGWDQGALVRHRVTGQTPYLMLPGSGTVTTADKASLDIPGDFFGAIQFRGPCATPRGLGNIDPNLTTKTLTYLTKFDIASEISFYVATVNGKPALGWSPDGTLAAGIGQVGSVRIPQPGAGTNTLAWWLDVNNGAGGWTLRWYWDRLSITALIARIAAGDLTVRLGADSTFSGVTSIHSGTANLIVAGVIDAFSSSPWGQVEAIQLRAGDHTGTIIANPDFTAQGVGAGAFVDTSPTPNTWTLSGGPAIADYEVRQVAEISALRPGWPAVGVADLAQVDMTAQGCSRRLRLNQRTKVLESSLFRWITTLNEFKDDIVAYWPYEDGASSTQAASPIPGVDPIRLSGAYSLGATSPLPAASTVMRVGSGDAVYQEAEIPPIPQAVGVNWQVIRGFNTNDPAVSPAATQLMAVDSNGRVATWRITINDTQMAISGLDENEVGVVLATRASDPSWFTGPCFAKLKLTDNGANVDWEAQVITNPGLSAVVYSTSGSYAGDTGIPQRFRNNLVGPPGGIDVSHLVVTTDNVRITDDHAASAYAGELDYDRIRRLCLEERVYISVHPAGGPAADPGEAMGPQLPKGFVELLEEAAAAGGGILHEHRTENGFQYRTRRSMVNQTPRLTVGEALAPPFQPVADDAGRTNLATVTRQDGSSATQRDQADIDKRGEYPDGQTLNLYRDAQTGPLAGWQLHLGTPEEMRVETLTIEGSVQPTVIPAAWIGCSPGDVVTCIAPPPHWPAATVDQLIEGYTETWSPFLATIVPNTSPASLWNVGEAGVTRADTTGSVLHALATSSATSLDVASTHRGARWRSTTGGAVLPFPIVAAGEEMSATAIADTLFTFGAVGTATHADNAAVTPGAPAGVVTGNLLVILAAIRNLGTGTVNVPSGWTRWPLFNDTENVALLARVAQSNGEAMPSVTFTGGVAGADTSAQCARFGGSFHDVANLPVRWGRVGSLSAADIAYPATQVPYRNSLVLYVGWRADDWTSVATIAGATEIGDAPTITGNDQGIVWDYLIQTTPVDIAAGAFTVTGGAANVVLGGVIVLCPDRQTFTVVRSTNGVVKAQAAGAAVGLARSVRSVAAR